MASGTDASSDIRLANRQALADYLVRLNAHLQAYAGVNPFWREITDAFRNQFVPPTDAGRASDVVDAILARIDAMPKTGYFIHPVAAGQAEPAWRQILADSADRGAVRHDKARHEAAIIASFLAHRGLLDEARGTLDAIRIEPKYVTLRHFFYFTQIREAVARQTGSGSPASVLEIGAGGSTLKLLLKHHLGERIDNYTIVDLPEMLCLSIKAAIDFLPDQELQIVSKGEDIDTSKASVFVPADLTAAIPRAPVFDLFLNTHSFQEMDPGVIASYFRLIYGSARKDAIFFQTNLVQRDMTRLDGSRFYNDPASYPFRSSDEVLYRQEDPFHVYARDRFGYKRTPSLTSIHRIATHEAIADDAIDQRYLARTRSGPGLIHRLAAAVRRRIAAQ